LIPKKNKRILTGFWLIWFLIISVTVLTRFSVIVCQDSGTEMEEITPTPPPQPVIYQTEDFIIYFPVEPEELYAVAFQFLGDPFLAFRIQEFNQISEAQPGQGIIIPRNPIYPGGIKPQGLQVIPMLSYRNLAETSKNSRTISENMFRNQIKFLADKGFATISLSKFYDFMMLKQDLPRNSVIITLDDSNSAVLDTAVPVLREYGFIAEVFLYADSIGKGKNALTVEQLKQLETDGFSIQSQGKSRTNYQAKNKDESFDAYSKRISNEFEESKKTLETTISAPVNFIAYPSGVGDAEMVQLAAKTGYLGGITTNPGPNSILNEIYRLNRFTISPDDNLDSFAKYLVTFQPLAAKGISK
jgi:peptidoglycan/xylan/chitin deacetylase (PgdA/CDA1 family)